MTNKPIRPVPDRPGTAADDLKAVRMMNDRVLVRPPADEEERRSKGGLLIPATAASVNKQGVWVEVVAAGPNAKNVEPGDQVLLLPDSGIEVEIRGEDFLLVREREIHAVATDREDPGSGLYL